MVNHEITLLDEDTIGKISAGEVIEQPASVVKELVENSIDAGADSITVEIKDGGLSYIRVTDNGSGIEKDQIRKAFLRHSTSKIKDAEDLYYVHTLGFRGEALASIAAVSKLQLYTKAKKDILGSQLVMEGGIEKDFSDAGTPDGTTFIISDLFFNTPVRKKFLQSKTTEANHIQDIVEHIALSHPEISFRLISGGNEKLLTPGNGSLKDTIYKILGREIVSNILPIETETETCKIHGFIGTSVINRGNRKYETFFVNSRYVHDKALSRAVEEGYEGYMMQHQYPFFILFLEFPDGAVDVNFHPKKEEVRFENKALICDDLKKAIAERLGQREDIDTVPLAEIKKEFFSDKTETDTFSSLYEEAEDIEVHEKKSGELYENKKQTSDDSYSNADRIVNNISKINPLDEEISEKDTEPIAQKYHGYEPFENRASIREAVQEEDTPPVKYEQRTFLTEESRPYFNIVGQVFDTYWIIEYQKKMYIVDQHAAHEKVNYERLVKKVNSQSVTTQLLSPPIIISLNNEEQEILNRYQDDFDALGFRISNFGGNDFVLTEVPYEMDSVDKKQLFLDIISDAGKWKNLAETKLVKERLATMACKASIKGNQHISRAEIEELISELLTLDNPYHCPHGRPTMVAFDRSDLDKMFKRIV